MLKRYIKDIVKTELTKQKLKDIYSSQRSYNLNSVSDKERQELNEQISTLKNYHNNIVERNKYLKLEISRLKRENEKLEESIENLGGTVSLKDNLLNEKNKEIEELKYLYEQEKNKNYKTLESEELKQENEKLQSKVDEYYNKFLSEAIKKEQAQELIRKVKKEIVLQGFDQDDFFSPEQTFYRIKNILKES